MIQLNKRALKKYTRGDKVAIVSSGKEYFDQLEALINEAKKEIHLQTYILSDDETGQRILNALIRAVRRGVDVYILADGYGSRTLGVYFVEQMKATGIHFRFFAPLVTMSGFNFGRHLHRKVTVIDGETALLGGINIANRYSGWGGTTPWLDFGLLVRGPSAVKIAAICRQLWRKKFVTQKVPKENSSAGQTFLRITQNDWLRRKAEISHSVRAAIRGAEREITIVGAYFMPSLRMRHLLAKAAKRGVKVRIILSRESDELVFRLAMNYLYSWFLEHDIEIYEFRPAVVHGKAIVIDREWLTIGSHDLNFLSTYGLIEMNANVLNKKLAGEFALKLDHIMSQSCDRVEIREIEKRKLQKLLAFFAYLSMRFSQWFITLFTVKDTSES